MYLRFRNIYTISVKEVDGISTVKARVTDFTDGIGYCEYKIPFFAKNIYVKTLDMQKGEEHHEEAERTEKETSVAVPLTVAALHDAQCDLDFFREDIDTIYARDFQSIKGNARLVLFGRADKIIRRESTLIIHDDKRTNNPSRHDGRGSPFLDNRLQVLTYLHSKFFLGRRYGGWVDIPHTSKKYRLNIIDGRTKQIYKTYEEVVEQEHLSLLERYASEFTFKCLQWIPLRHHNNINKCTPCGYKTCEFRMH
jgi:hypothetical protein